VDPLDLNVPAARLPDWYDPAPVEALYDAAQAWPVYDATCDAAPCASGQTPFDDLAAISTCAKVVAPATTGGLDCMVDGAAGTNSVIFLPAGTYDLQNPITVTAGGVVLRGAGATTILEAQRNQRGTAGGCAADDASGLLVSICSESPFTGLDVNWTGGYAIGDTVISVADTATFPVDTWVMLRMNDVLGCSIVDETAAQDLFVHYAQVDARSVSSGAGTITIDRPLVMDYAKTGCTYPTVPHYATAMNPVVGFGVEDLRLTTSPAVALCTNDQLFPPDPPGDGTGCPQGSTSWFRWRPVGIANAVQSWFVNVKIDRVYEDFINIEYSSRLWLQGLWIENGSINSDNLAGGIRVRSSSDVVLENTICERARVCVQNEAGGESTVVAYNYFDIEKIAAEAACTGLTQFGNSCEAEKAIFNHGRYARHLLAEGNDLDGRVTIADVWWSRNGPYHTLYRNRNRLDGTTADDCSGPNYGLLAFDHQESANPGGFTEYVTVVGNTAVGYASRPSTGTDCPNLDPIYGLSRNIEHLWLEKNAWRANNYFEDTSPPFGCNPGEGYCAFYTLDKTPGTNNAITSFGTVAGENDHGGSSAFTGTNFYTLAPHASWNVATANYPTSLYRTAAPSWWCQEACAWDQTGIGAFGDDFGGTLCKLPAQIRFEGGTCTAMGAPAPPVLSGATFGGGMSGSIGSQ
jgi:hypothetical protein